MVAAGANADALYIANHLWNDETVRTAVADAAAEFVGKAIEEPVVLDAGALNEKVGTLIAERKVLKADRKRAKETRAAAPQGSVRRERASEEISSLSATIEATTREIAATRTELTSAEAQAPAVTPCEIPEATASPSVAPTEGDEVVNGASKSELASAFCCSDPEGTDAVEGEPSSTQGRLDGCLAALKELEALGVPMGWPIDPWDWSDPRVPNDLGELAMKLAGLALTAAALSFGAAFWFDLLGKLVNLRNAGTKPKAEESTR